jgi:ABC-type glycerol-3-phosphate transport system substrate-binding protein
MSLKIEFLLAMALIVTASGCLNADNSSTISYTNNSTGSADQVKFADCGDIQVRIDQAASTAMIRQMNQEAIGEVEVEWVFVDGRSASKTVNLSERGGLRFIDSGLNGEVESFSVASSRCPGKVFSSS